MEYCVFLEQVRQSVQDKEGDESSVRIAPVLKNNQNYIDTMTILNQEGNIAPAIYMAPYYQQYLDGNTLDQIAEQILEFHNGHVKKGRYDISFYRDFSKVRDRVVCKLVNYEKNRIMLENMPHRRFLDLAIVYYYKLEDDTFGKASILVKNEHLAMWDSDLEELNDAAVSNTVRLLPYECIEISDMLREMTGLALDQDFSEQFPMYVLTNMEKSCGAVAIIYESILEAIAERLDSDFFVLPSSIHECMLIPSEKDIRIEELQMMVREINEEYVLEEEILGDSVYRYFRSEKKLRIVS